MDDEEFDLLMEGSSIGTPVAVARQALTPPQVRARFKAHLEGLGYGSSGGVPVSDAVVQCLADGAEAGYDLGVLRSRGG